LVLLYLYKIKDKTSKGVTDGKNKYKMTEDEFNETSLIGEFEAIVEEDTTDTKRQRSH